MAMRIYPAMLMAVILFASSTPAHGNGGEAIDLSLIRKVPELKQACKDASKPGWDSGITDKMLRASSDYQDCLIEIIGQILKAYFPPEKKDLLKRVRDIGTEVESLYWNIYCFREGYCGTFDKALSMAEQSRFIDDILDTMVKNIEMELR